MVNAKIGIGIDQLDCGEIPEHLLDAHLDAGE